MLVRAIRGDFSAHYYTPVDMVGLYWHLVDLIWIYLFPLLYLISIGANEAHTTTHITAAPKIYTRLLALLALTSITVLPREFDFGSRQRRDRAGDRDDQGVAGRALLHAPAGQAR